MKSVLEDATNWRLHVLQAAEYAIAARNGKYRARVRRSATLDNTAKN